MSGGRLIQLTDRQARIVAAWWQDGQLPGGLASLASSGAITDDVLPEIDSNVGIARDPAQKLGLAALAAYCRLNGPRNAVPGWHNLNWSGAEEERLEAQFRALVAAGGSAA